jgi:hypothetical protein
MGTNGTDPPSDPPYQRIEIEGIPAFVAHDAIRYVGSLLFRTGRADEPLRHAGLSHLVEHLALFGLGPHQPYAFNGWVGALLTCFYATGSPDEVGGFLNAVAKSLRELPLARLKDEARVLRTEAMANSAGPVGHLMWLRYGNTGHGTIGLPEFELNAPSPDAVSDWARSRFTAGNAALWFSGPPPKNLALGLEPGPRFETPPLAPVSDVRYPAVAHTNPGGLGISFVAPRSDWLSVPLGIAAQRVRSKLRFERGFLYEVGMGYEPLQKDMAHACLWSACLGEHESAVRDGMLEVLEEMAESGASSEELEQQRGIYRRFQRDPEAFSDSLMAAASNELLGAPITTPGELARELDALDPSEIRRRVSAALESALLVLPPTCPSPLTRFQPYPAWSQRVAVGRSFRSAASRFPWSKGPSLVVGERGASLVISSDRAVTVDYADCAVAVLHPGEVLEIYAHDGFRLFVQPEQWRNGGKAVEWMLDRLPAERIVRSEKPVPDSRPAGGA